MGTRIFDDGVELPGEVHISRYVLILDGWDEISAAASRGYQKELEKLLRGIRDEFLRNRQVKVRVILAGRPTRAVADSGFFQAATRVLTVRPMNPDQLENLVGRFREAVVAHPIEVEHGDPWSLEGAGEVLGKLGGLYSEEWKEVEKAISNAGGSRPRGSFPQTTLPSWVVLTGANLIGSDFTGSDLTGADLVGSNLAGGKFAFMNLVGAGFIDADLAGANFTGANLTGAYLCAAYLYKANLHEADFTGADLTGTQLAGADLTGADLTGANLENATVFTEALSSTIGRPEVLPDGTQPKTDEEYRAWLNRNETKDA